MNNIKTWLGILITIALLYVIFKKADFAQIVNSLKGAKYYYLFPSIVSLIISFYIRAIRWSYLLRPIKNITTKTLFPMMMIGFMANDILPARIGEFVRAYIIGKKENISKSTSFATIVIERLFDIFTLLLLMLVLFVFWGSCFPYWIRKSGVVVMVFTLVCLLILFSMKAYLSFFIKLFHKFFFFISSNIREKIAIRLQHFTFGLSVFKSFKLILVSFFYSLLVWLFIAASVYFALLIFDFNIPIYAPLFVTIILAIGLMVPSAPGFIGTFQFACISSLSLFSVDENAALSFSIILHAAQFFPVILIGYLFMLKEQMSFSAISKMSNNGSPE
ncbi:MAG: lysylphosphatidylglycerol synthase transmembrane domain-containing protein [bacterium]|nr:lysylphosphatidylglycerol synthase transmembrane domain-containing protein [bacterium]